MQGELGCSSTAARCTQMFSGCVPSGTCSPRRHLGVADDCHTPDDSDLLHDAENSATASSGDWLNGLDVPFGVVNTVLASSPGDVAGLREGDIVFQFGHLTELGYAATLGLTDTHTITPLRLSTTFPSLVVALGAFVRTCAGTKLPVIVTRQQDGKAQKLELESLLPAHPWLVYRTSRG